jgi:asparagine synthase (glutamine-hydrolysing)
MSGFAVLFDIAGQPINAESLDVTRFQMSHRGPDGFDELRVGPIWMAHWHFWTTPEEVGERQPLSLDDLPFYLVFDGRLDNREELLGLLSISPEPGTLLSDAAIVLRAYAAWGERCVEKFIGDFAFVLYDKHRQIVFCARDHLGASTLFYALQGNRLAVSSDPLPAALLRGLPLEQDDTAVAHYFAFREHPAGQSFFKGVTQLPPAHAFRFQDGQLRTWCYWQMEPGQRIRYKTDREYGEHFLSLMTESVRCRMRSVGPTAVLMSGGLDSTSVACLAAQMIAPQQLITISYVFNRFPECDERRYINTVKEKWNTISHQIPSDDVWPYKGIFSPDACQRQMPIGSPYRPIHQRVFQFVHESGVRVMLSGVFGDDLYLYGKWWLPGLLAEARLSRAVREILAQARVRGPGFVLRNDLRLLLRSMLDALPGGRSIRRLSDGPAWLTELSTRLLAADQPESSALEKYGIMTSGFVASAAARSKSEMNCDGLEPRYPYRDKRLFDFVLNVPAYILHAQGMYKHVLREAMRGILPEEIRTRRIPTTMLPFYFYGINIEKENLSAYIRRQGLRWREFVNPDWLLKHWDKPVLSQEQDGPELAVFWLCVAYTLWYERIFSTQFSEGDL